MLTALLALTAYADPVQLPHQGRLMDGAGLPLTGTHDLTFSLYDVSVNGTALWTETQTIDLDDGYYAENLGLDIANPIQDSTLDAAALYLGVSVDGGAELDRVRIGAVAYARRAAVATDLSGGVVDATEIRIGGNTVIDGSGSVVSGTTLDGLNCQSDQLPLFDGTSWGCAAAASSTTLWDDIVGVPAEISDGDDDTLGSLVCADGQVVAWSTSDSRWLCADDIDTDTQLSDAEVDAFVENNALDLAAGSTIAGQPFVTVDTNTQLSDAEVDAFVENGALNLAAGSTIGGLPIITVDTNTQLTDAEVDAFVENGSLDLAAGSTMGGQPITTGPHPTSLPWADITGKPAGFADDVDNDALTVLGSSCSAGDHPEWNGSSWICAQIPTSTVAMADMVRADGSSGSGSNVDMATLSVNLTGMAGRYLHIYGHTAMGEQGNTSNTMILRVMIDNGSTSEVVSAQRQGVGVHNQTVDWTGNLTAAISAQGYFLITPQYATNVTLRLNGGIDSGLFYYGDQPSYGHYDGQDAGVTLGYAVF